LPEEARSATKPSAEASDAEVVERALRSYDFPELGEAEAYGEVVDKAAIEAKHEQAKQCKKEHIRNEWSIPSAGLPGRRVAILRRSGPHLDLRHIRGQTPDPTPVAPAGRRGYARGVHVLRRESPMRPAS
jgi:hypothetical protein